MNNKPNQPHGGQNQRVAVARALVNRPSVVIGDELTGNLDTKSSNMIYELLRDLNRKMNQTFILVTHDMHMAEKCHDLCSACEPFGRHLPGIQGIQDGPCRGHWKRVMMPAI